MARASFLKLTRPTTTTNDDQTSAEFPESPSGIQSNPSSHPTSWSGMPPGRKWPLPVAEHATLDSAADTAQVKTGAWRCTGGPHPLQ